MSQYTINIGTLPNDGTGDPLRTAFNETNLNFDQVFAAGPVLSNIQIANNSILTTNTNGNLVLVPNGIGTVQANASIVPNLANIRNLGSSTQRWATVYTQYLNVSSGTSVNGDLTVGGNLTVTGNIIEMGNIITDAKTIQLANTATTASSANGSGITVGANDSIATILYNSNANVWTTNVGISTTGNITGGNIIGNIVAADGNTSVQINVNGFLGAAAGFSYDYVGNTLYAPTATFAGFSTNGTNGLFVGLPLYTPLGSNIVTQITSNVASYSQINQQNISTSNVASGDYIITANNGTDSTYFIDLGLTGSSWDGTQDNSLGNKIGANEGYLYVQDGNLNLGTAINSTSNVWILDTAGNTTVPGNIIPDTNNVYSLGNSTNQWSDLYVSNSTIYMNNVPITLGAGNVLTVDGNAVLTNDSNATISTTGNIVANYFFGNGSQLTGLPETYSNANVVTLMANFGSNNISTTGNITGNISAPNGNGAVLINRNGIIGATAGFNFSLTSNMFYSPAASFPGDNNGSNGLFVGRPSFTALGSDILGQFTGEVNSYSQINIQNTSNASASSGDYIITADNGTDSTHFIDLGITGSTWDGTQPNSLGNRLGANDGYLYVQDGDFVLGTSNGTIETWKFDQSGNLTTPGDIIVTGNVLSTQSTGLTVGSNFDVFIVADRTDNNLTWKFDGSSGETQFPGDLIGTGASPAPSINGFNSINSVTVNASGNVTGGNLLANSRVISTPVALAGLTAVAGARAFVSDGNLVASGNFGAQIGGSGANTVPVWSDGVNWYIG